MGHGFDRIKELFKDNYKDGVTKANKSGLPNIYIDPTRIPGWDADILRKKITIDDKTGEYNFDKLTQTERNFLVKRIRDQLEEQISGITDGVTDKSLILLLKSSLEIGLYSDQESIPGVCVINLPNGNSEDPDGYNAYLGIDNYFIKNHLLPLPGSVAIWRRLSGEHEGEHCNQGHIERSGEHGHLGALTGEILSDRESLKTLRAEGHHDVVQAWIDLRVLSAANGGISHATSIFLNNDADFKVTEDHYKAAKQFVQDMNMAVAERLDISDEQAEELRIKDPQRFVNEVEKSLKEGIIPYKTKEIEWEDKLPLIIKEMGFESKEQLEKMSVTDSKRFLNAIKKLNSEGTFNESRADIAPIITQYVEQYIGAVRRLFIPDTTPKMTVEQTGNTTVETEKPEPYLMKTDQEIVAELTDDELWRDANTQCATVAEAAIAKELGVDPDNLWKQKPENIVKAIDKILQSNIPEFRMAVYERSYIDEEQVMAQKLGLTLKDIESLPAEQNILIKASFRNSGAFGFIYENPYMLEKCIEFLQSTKKELTPEASTQQEADKNAKLSEFKLYGDGVTGQQADPYPEKKPEIVVASSQPAILQKPASPSYQPS